MTLSIYVHIPFCIKKCHYCDFVSYTLHDARELQGMDPGGYIELLLREAAIYRIDEHIPKCKVSTLYIGGGTPTCLAGGQLFILLNQLQKEFIFAVNAEITVEANPGTVDKNKLIDLRAAGCNRLSIGIQSFDSRELQFLGRIHRADEVYSAYYLARECGFTNINLDLMYGLPGQTEEEWHKNLRKAVELSPEHLSLYQLNIEQNTPLYKSLQEGDFTEPEQEITARMFEQTIGYLKDNGYKHYEISNFAKPGYESKHNKAYWRNAEYLGLGAGACGYWQGERYCNKKVLEAYQLDILNGIKPVGEVETINRDLSMAEHMFLGLRLLEGVNKHLFFDKFSLELHDVFGGAIEKLIKQELLQETDTHLRLTSKGLFLANNVFMEFLTD